MGVLRHDFLPAALRLETEAVHIEGVVSVQARQSVLETEWLLEQSAGQSWIQGVVGWLPLAEPTIGDYLDRFRDQRKLKGLRHVIQDERDDGFMAGADFNRGIRAMKDCGWTYDILIYGRQLPFAIPFVDQHPEQVFVLDHIAKPTIQNEELDESWERGFRELAKRPNVFCKFSGVVTEVRGNGWTIQQIQPYWEAALDAFGTSRLMFGSDWPVCLLKASYTDWFAAINTLASKLSQAEQENFWAKNAIRAYGLG